MMNTIQTWLFTVFAGKLVARLAVTVAGALAAGPIHSGLAMLGFSVQIDQATFAAGSIALSHVAYEWLKAKRVPALAPPAVTPKG